MKYFLCFLSLFFLLFFSGISQSVGGSIGDLNADGRIGLDDAINALSVAAGLRTAPSDITYNIDEFRCKSNSEYVYIEKSGDDYGIHNRILTLSVSNETVNGTVFQTLNYNGGLEDGNKIYQLFDGKNLIIAGETDRYEQKWFSPGFIKGSVGMKIGDVFHSVSVIKRNYGDYLTFREILIMGQKNITVPAGRFNNCLVIRTINYDDIYLSYLAKNIGLVKFIGSHGGDSGEPFVWELISANIEGSVFPSEGVNICLAQGQWTQVAGGPQSNASGSFSFYFNSKKRPIYLSLSFNGLNRYPSIFYLISNDGIHFSADGTRYGANNSPDISLTLSEGSITGNYEYNSGDDLVKYSISGTYTSNIQTHSGD